MMKQTRKRVRFEVEISGEWFTCKHAAVQPSKWLHAELFDGTITLVRPSRWRVKETPAKVGKIIS